MKKSKRKIKVMLDLDLANLDQSFSDLDRHLEDEQIKSHYVQLAKAAMHRCMKHLHNALAIDFE